MFKLNTLILLGAIGCCFNLFAEQYLGLVAGKGMDDTLIQSGSTSGANVKGFAYRRDLIVNELAENFDGLQWLSRPSLALDIESYNLVGHFDAETFETSIFAIKPTFIWASESSFWFAEFAVGAAYMDEKQFEEIQTSSNWQFAIHAGTGFFVDSASDWKLTFRYNHFSNGYLDQPNPGLDFVSLNLLYRI
ncbi:MAG: acyloxyacyl hydrolase [Gammaproteobacteria bacterium]|nr:acyloxyacyl hydrolase [Gammaproteobacteria bacterium]